MSLGGTQDLREVDGDIVGLCSSSDSDDSHVDLNTELTCIDRVTKDLNIVDGYRPTWTCKEAFRELYQNWRDGISRSFSLDQSQFRPTYTENLNGKKGSIIIDARHPDTSELLGFIHFKSDTDGYCVGGLKIVNFKATLKYRDLGTGSTTKASDKEQTGQHGDGMKISALVYRRSNYNVCYESGGFKWRFLYRKGSLACSLSRINTKSLETKKRKAKDQPRTHVAHPWEDVCLVIAAPGKTRNIMGFKGKTQRLHIDDFRSWITVTIDINPPKNIVRTVYGDLIRDKRYRAHMYLRGLLLPGGGTTRDNYTCGYNFVQGSTNSDREALSFAAEESESISAIWSAAIQDDTSDDSELVSHYTSLLLKSINNKGDVSMQKHGRADELMPGDIARKVWAKMLTLNKDAEGRTAFYYPAGKDKDDAHIIKQSLRKNPVSIHPDLWRILKSYYLCSTPRDELFRRFKSATPVDIPSNSFAKHVSKMLECLLMSSPLTKDMKLKFVDGEHLDIYACFTTEWSIHSKWLSWEGAHDQTFCEENQPAESGPFTCDHAVLQLWNIIISQLTATGNYPQVSTKEHWLKSMAMTRLSQMPRSVECNPTQKKGISARCVGDASFGPLNISNSDDETEDNNSLYRKPSSSPPPAPRSSNLQQICSKSTQADLTTWPKKETYVIGTEVEHKSLDWGGSFPGSHDFYRARDQPDQKVFVLKPKVIVGKSGHKRMHSGADDRVDAKKSRSSATVIPRRTVGCGMSDSGLESEEDVSSEIAFGPPSC
ncbi:hypothetical protein ACET3X_008888 [Alternaria dauci]|uniref:Uncharacterized protein n=1 Tax=Alternaria dauci TaxID=48095 RepID=A0ABR3U9T2_9PLEO